MDCDARDFNGCYAGDFLEHTAFPLGGMGAGMLCLEGAGALSHISLRHRPDVFRRAFIFGALSWEDADRSVKCKLIEGAFPERLVFGTPGTGNGGSNGSTGSGWPTIGLPRFHNTVFNARFPFATVELTDPACPLTATLTGWSPFTPPEPDDSSLPVAALEYELRNTSERTIRGFFSFNHGNPSLINTGKGDCVVRKLSDGLCFEQRAGENPWDEGYFTIRSSDTDVLVDPAWFRGGWFDTPTMLWNTLTSAIPQEKQEITEAPFSAGGSLFVPFTLEPGAARVVKIMLSWYVPQSNVHHRGGDKAACSCTSATANVGEYYRPWYAERFSGPTALADYWRGNYERLRTASARFRDCFQRSTLPPEVLEAVAANLTILKSPTVLRQWDGRFWAWEGSCDGVGCCAGSCTHVWNYAQALPHLFPELERSLRQTEFNACQDENGHQNFRASLPIQPTPHDSHAAADGQLGGIMKVHRDWRISGDTQWLRELWPKVKKSIDYCITTWDPRGTGLLEEPHHNTYDIEFWGPDGMCSSFYLGALKAMALMGRFLGEDTKKYSDLYVKGRERMETDLFNGEYFFQKIRWTGLNSPNPTEAKSLIDASYSPEAAALLEKEGPRYQYGKGCLADGVLGAWLARVCGIGEIIDPRKVESHLLAVHKYNLKKDLTEHVNPQRPSFAIGSDGGLLLCTWPQGGKLSLPFPYSNEVWTGIEYQVASHLAFFGRVAEAMEIVQTARRRYDGRRRNPFNEYECGHWYARAMSSFGLLQGMGGVWYDAVDKTLIMSNRTQKDFEVFLATATGYGTAGMKNGKPFVKTDHGTIQVDNVRFNDDKSLT